MPSVRNFIMSLMSAGIKTPVILVVESNDVTIDEQLIHFSTEAGALLLDGMGDGVWLMNDAGLIQNAKVSGRTYLETTNNFQKRLRSYPNWPTINSIFVVDRSMRRSLSKE